MNYQINDHIRIEVESLAYKGWGVSRTEGQVVFIEGGCPGDLLDVKITKVRESHLYGQVEEVIRSGPGRRPADCLVASRCGGCQWQHIDEHVQHDQKVAIFRDLLKRIGGLDLEGTGKREIVAMTPVRGSSFSYRTRLRVAILPKGPALRMLGSQEKLLIPGCPVAVEPLNRLIEEWIERTPPWFESGGFHEAELTWYEQPGVVQVNLIARRGRRVYLPKNSQTVGGVGVYFSVNGCWPGGNPPRSLRGLEYYTYSIPGEILGRSKPLLMDMDPGDFIQPNGVENATLVEAVLGLSQSSKCLRVLDLYCGVGNFSLPLALSGAQVWGIDSSVSSIEKARCNAKKNEIEGCDFQSLTAKNAIGRFVDNKGFFDLVVIDPPRSGCKDILEDLARLDPKRIVYVSCNPSTLARDLKILSGLGYTLLESRLVDLFPQTYHIESVNLLAHSIQSEAS